MLKGATVKGFGHFRGLGDAYCDIGYYYDPSVDNCLPMDTTGSVCDTGWYWDSALDSCQPQGGSGIDTSQTVATDGGNAQIWQQIIAATGRIATMVIQANNTQYQTRYGTYAYGTGPYSALTPSLAQQYLASRSVFGGLSTNTMLLIGGGLLLAFMMMRR